MVSLGEQDALAQQVGFRSSVHLSFDHLDAVDVAFDGAGSPGQGEAGGDGGPVLAQAGGEAPHFLDGAGLGLVDPGGSSLPWRWVIMSPNWRTRVRVASSSGQRAVMAASRGFPRGQFALAGLRVQGG
jgi:hypothetical protein